MLFDKNVHGLKCILCHFKPPNVVFYPYPPPSSCQGGDSSQFEYSVNPVLPFEIPKTRNAKFSTKKVYWWGGGGLFDYSVKPGPDLSRSRLGLVKLLTKTAKAMFAQVDYQVSQVKDQVGQGQELDNC